MFPVDNIRKFAKAKGLTLAEVERTLGFGNGVLAKWETAKRPPDQDRVAMIAELLGVSVEELQTGIKKEPSQKERLDEKAIWSAAWDSASPAARQAALSVLMLGVQPPEAQDAPPSDE